MIKESKFAKFVYQKGDEDVVDSLAKYLDEHGKVAFDFFEVEVPQEKIQINIIPTKKEYDEIYIKERNFPPQTKLYGWMIGNYLFEKNQITYLSLHDFKDTTHKLKDTPFLEAMDYYQKTILHEFIHYANGLFRQKHNCGYAEKYLTEGIAAYLSGQYQDTKLNFDFTATDLLDKSKNIYYAYFLITKFFVENYDKKTVLKTFESSRESKEILQNGLFKKAKNFYKNKIK